MEQMIRLADAIRALRAELLAGVQEGYEEDVRLALGTVEFDVEVEISKSASGDGRIEFRVVGDMPVAAARRATHRVRINLAPTLGGGTPGGVPLVVASEAVRRPS